MNRANSVIQFLPEDVPSLLDRESSARRVSALRTAVTRAVAENGTVTISIQNDKGVDTPATDDVLRELQAILTGTTQHLWSSLQNGSLTLSSEAPFLSLTQIDKTLQGAANHIQRSGSLDSLGLTEQAWGEHLKAVQAHLRDQLRQANEGRQRPKLQKLDPSTNERRIRGCVSELVLQRMLAASFVQNRDTSHDARLMDRESRFTLPPVPKGHSGDQYVLRPTTRYNFEIHYSAPIGNTHVRQRHSPQKLSEGRLTEMDAAIATGFDEQRKTFSRLYVFDTTTSDDQFRRKLLDKPSQLQRFIEDMEDRGLDVQIVIVEMASPDIPIKMMRDDRGRGHISGIVLRPGNIVHELTKKTAQELHLEIPRH